MRNGHLFVAVGAEKSTTVNGPARLQTHVILAAATSLSAEQPSAHHFVGNLEHFWVDFMVDGIAMAVNSSTEVADATESDVVIVAEPLSKIPGATVKPAMLHPSFLRPKPGLPNMKCQFNRQHNVG